ncbi:MAG: MarR family winged helix-turn-helix transcriptional regulator [Saprospiraceae bacterium]
MKIEDAIQQKKFQDEHHKAQLNVLYTSTWINQLSNQALKPFDLSWQQFNVLRILRGLKGEPATVKLLTERMIDKMSNASRLVDKLLKKEYVERQTCPDDRRRVDVLLTETGLQAVNDASDAISEMMETHTRNITIDEAIELNRILDKLRSDQDDQ